MGLLLGDVKNREHIVVLGVALGLIGKAVHEGSNERNTFTTTFTYSKVWNGATNMDFKNFLRSLSFQENFLIIMSPFIVAFIAFILLFIFRILNIASQPRKPEILCKDEKFAALLREAAPELEQA